MRLWRARQDSNLRAGLPAAALRTGSCPYRTATQQPCALAYTGQHHYRSDILLRDTQTCYPCLRGNALHNNPSFPAHVLSFRIWELAPACTFFPLALTILQLAHPTSRPSGEKRNHRHLYPDLLRCHIMHLRCTEDRKI